MNLPRTLATVVSSRLATLHELDSVYSVSDMWDLLEINTIDAHNRALMQET